MLAAVIRNLVPQTPRVWFLGRQQSRDHRNSRPSRSGSTRLSMSPFFGNELFVIRSGQKRIYLAGVLQGELDNPSAVGVLIDFLGRGGQFTIDLRHGTRGGSKQIRHRLNRLYAPESLPRRDLRP